MNQSDRDRPPSLRDLDRRLQSARERIERRSGRAGSDDGAGGRGLGVGLRIAVELAAAIAVGTGIGIFLDRWLGTSPWLLIVFFVFGCAAGFLNLYRTAQELDRSSKERKSVEPTDPD